MARSQRMTNGRVAMAGRSRRSVAYDNAIGRLRNTVSTVALLLMISVSPVGAQTLRSQVGDLTQTPQDRENARWWDERKQYGAIAVDERDRTQYLSEGWRFGNYIIRPTGEVRKHYTDNVYRTSKERTGDFAVELNPKVKFVSQFARHALNIDVGGTYRKYNKADNLDTLGGFVRAEGALHINHAHTISFSLVSDYTHEFALASTFTQLANERTPIWTNKAELGITRDAGRLAVTAGVAYNSYDFFDVKAQQGPKIDQDLRDAKIYSSDLKLRYRFSPGYSFEARAKGLRTLTDRPDNQTGDSWGAEVAVGLRGEVSPLLHWRFMVGYAARDFDDPALALAQAGIFDAQIRWLITERLTIIADAERGFNFTDDEEGSINTVGSLRFLIEARDNLIFTVGGSYGLLERLNGRGSEEKFGWEAGLDYLYTQHLHFNLKYEGELTTGDTNFDDVQENRVWAGFKILF
ncbi:MAG: outer membrane beta-barrel protein [Pseudomonadota bacterium]